MQYNIGDKVVIDNDYNNICTVTEIYETPGEDKEIRVSLHRPGTGFSWNINSTRIKKVKEENK